MNRQASRLPNPSYTVGTKRRIDFKCHTTRITITFNPANKLSVIRLVIHRIIGHRSMAVGMDTPSGKAVGTAAAGMAVGAVITMAVGAITAAVGAAATMADMAVIAHRHFRLTKTDNHSAYSLY
jgi:hypothetical protein